jgi:cytochrome c-type biogenesis protein CcmH
MTSPWNRQRGGLAAATLLVGLALAPAPAIALQSPAADSTAAGAGGPRLSDAQEARARSLEAKLKCPVCRTQSVLESTSFMALEMRAKIRELIAAGRTDRQILDYFVDRYGDYILLEPRRRGFGLSAYLLPLLAVLAGAALLAAGLRRKGRRAQGRATTSAAGGDREPGSPSVPPLSDEDRTRVEEELRRYTV